MRHDLHLHGKTTEGDECDAIISIYANDEGGFQQQLEWWAPRLAWFLKRPGHAEVPSEAKIEVERVERIKESPTPQFQRMMAGLPPGLSQIFGELFMSGPHAPDEDPEAK